MGDFKRTVWLFPLCHNVSFQPDATQEIFGKARYTPNTESKKGLVVYQHYSLH